MEDGVSFQVKEKYTDFKSEAREPHNDDQVPQSQLGNLSRGRTLGVHGRATSLQGIHIVNSPA